MRLSLSTLRGPGRRTAGAVALWVLSVGLGLVFVTAGAVQLLNPEAATWFTGAGLPEWLCVVAGAAEVAGGALLLLPRTGALAAALLGTLLAGAITAHLALGGDRSIAPAFVLLGAVALVGYARRPGAATLARLTRAADWLAEREMAAQRRHARQRGTAGGGAPPRRRARRAEYEGAET
jgi:uncharacterized membrane protein YphA (DoxX/SURF4 family)